MDRDGEGGRADLMAVTSTGPMGDRRRFLVMRIAGLLISVVALAVVAGSMDLGEALRLAAGASVPILAAASGLIAVQLLLRAARWRILLPARPDGQRVPIRRVVPPLLAGYLGNAVLPARLGEPIRAVMVARRERLDALECLGATATERVIDTATLAIVAFGAALAVGTGWSTLTLTGGAAIAGVLVLGLLVTVGLSGAADAVTRRLTSRLGADRARAFRERVMAFAQGVDRGRVPRRLLAAAGISCICWGLDALVFGLVADSVGVPLAYSSAVLIAAVTVLGTADPRHPGTSAPSSSPRRPPPWRWVSRAPRRSPSPSSRTC